MTHTSPKTTTEANWYLIDAKKFVLGRLATQAARILQGKHRTNYAPNKLSPDHVIIVNTKEVKLTGLKREQKKYYRHSGYLGNLKTFTFDQIQDKDPNNILRLAIMGMLPKNDLRKQMVKHLHLYASETHPHKAQTIDLEVK